MLGPTSANQNFTTFPCLDITGGSTSVSQGLPTWHKLPNVSLRLPFAFYKESNPALTNWQVPSAVLSHFGL